MNENTIKKIGLLQAIALLILFSIGFIQGFTGIEDSVLIDLIAGVIALLMFILSLIYIVMYSMQKKKAIK